MREREREHKVNNLRSQPAVQVIHSNVRVNDAAAAAAAATFEIPFLNKPLRKKRTLTYAHSLTHSLIPQLCVCVYVQAARPSFYIFRLFISSFMHPHCTVLSSSLVRCSGNKQNSRPYLRMNLPAVIGGGVSGLVVTSYSQGGVAVDER